MNLYAHQESVIPEVLRSLRPDNPTLLVSPTGSGKTVMAAEIALHFKRVLFVAHRIEITTQARVELGAHVRVMSIHAAMHYGPEAVDLLIIDEAHRATAATYRAIIAKYKGCVVLGLTATPRRTDGQGLIDVFDEIVECSNVKELIESGHLVPYRAIEAPDAALKALDDMKRKRGDYEQSELSALMGQPRLIGNVVREYLKHGKGRRAVAFAVSVRHAQALCSALLAAGVRAAHLDGKSSPKMRAEELQKLSDHEIDVLCNVNLFTEGWDCPAVSCVIMARPTESITLYLQSVGRGMRASDGKNDLLILDHAGNIARHGYPDDAREWSLESKSQKAKREAEIKELNRLHALGFDSIEAELEERARVAALTYSNADVAGIFGISRREIAVFLLPRKVKVYSGYGLSARYLRLDIERISVLINKSYSSREAADALSILGVNLSPAAFLRRRGVMPYCFSGAATRYLKEDVDGLLRAVKAVYSSREAMRKLGIKHSNGLMKALRAAGIAPHSGSTRSCCYLKSEIDALSASRNKPRE